MRTRKKKHKPPGAGRARIAALSDQAGEIGSSNNACATDLPVPLDIESSPFFIWWELLAVTGAYIFVVFVLCPGTQLIAFPVHHDDFRNLAKTVVALSSWRPVSYMAVRLLAQIGLPAYYLSLHILVILYAFLSLDVIRRLLRVPKVPAILLPAIAAAMLSFENTIEYSKYSGLLTNLLSGVFAMAAMNLMTSAVDEDSERPSRSPSYTVIAAVWVLTAFSYWSKEDFVPALVAGSCYFAWQRLRNSARSSVYVWIMLAAPVVLSALLFFYNHQVQNPFTETTIGTYKPDFTLSSILTTAWTYVIVLPGTKAAFLLAASTLLWYRIGGRRIEWSRLLLFQTICAALALPYLCLPHHVFSYYAFNWAVWQTGGGLLLLWAVRPGVRSGILIVAVAAACLYATQLHRERLSRWYVGLSQVNRNVLQTLADYKSSLDPYPTIAVEGAPDHGPWFVANGEFLRDRLHADHLWLVRVPRESDYLRSTTALLLGATHLGRVKTVAIETEPLPPGVPLVHLRPDGTGTITFPSSEH